MASLFVADLHPNVTESILFKKFSSIGSILSLRICRQEATKSSLGYAYVNFTHQMYVDRAIETMNFDLLECRPIRLMRSERNRSLRTIGAPNVFIKNLHRVINNRTLFDVFSQFGKVLTCKVAQDHNGVSKGYGFIQFEDQKSARKSIDELNGLVVNNKKLCVERFAEQNIRETKGDINSNQTFNNVYVKNVDNDFNDEMLEKMFCKFGKIVSHKMMTNIDGTSRGFGFVAFESAESALNATLTLNGRITKSGKTLYVGRAQTKRERTLVLKRHLDELNNSGNEKRNLLVQNLDSTIDDVRLRNEFQPYGTITSTKVMMSEGRSIGFGYVCFSNVDEAKKAIVAMNGRIVGTKALFVAFAASKEGHHIKTPVGERRSFGMFAAAVTAANATNTNSLRSMKIGESRELPIPGIVHADANESLIKYKLQPSETAAEKISLQTILQILSAN